MAAAVLSNRYISDRFLPDKAIDLMDEAAAKLRTEIDSMPAELDEATRRLMQLEIEREALKKETDAASRDRLGKIEKELADLKTDDRALQAQWQAEKEALKKQRELREQIEQTQDRDRAGRARLRSEQGRRAEVRQADGARKSKLEEAGASRRRPLLKEEVDEEDIAAGGQPLDRRAGLEAARRRDAEASAPCATNCTSA